MAKAKHRTPNKHACKKNWTGTAKSMEPDMIVEILKEVKEKNNHVVTLIAQLSIEQGVKLVLVL